MPKNKKFTKNQYLLALEKTDGRCAYCGKVFEPDRVLENKSGWQVNWSLDHLIPKSKGGGDDYANLMPACTRCNSQKKDRDLEDFRLFFHSKELFYLKGDLGRVSLETCPIDLQAEFYLILKKIEKFRIEKIFYFETLK